MKIMFKILINSRIAFVQNILVVNASQPGFQPNAVDLCLMWMNYEKFWLFTDQGLELGVSSETKKSWVITISYVLLPK